MLKKNFNFLFMLLIFSSVFVSTTAFAHDSHIIEQTSAEQKMLAIAVTSIIIFLAGLLIGYYILQNLPSKYNNRNNKIYFVLLLSITLALNAIIFYLVL